MQYTYSFKVLEVLYSISNNQNIPAFCEFLANHCVFPYMEKYNITFHT